MSPHHSEPLDFLVSLAASALDDDAVPGLAAWKTYALGRPPEGKGDTRAERLPSDRAAISLFVRRRRADLFGPICEETWCRLAEDPGGRARRELIDSLVPLADRAVDELPPKLLATILVRVGLGRYCVCRSAPRCAGVTKSGEPCRREVGSPDELCWQHRFQREWFGLTLAQAAGFGG